MSGYNDTLYEFRGYSPSELMKLAGIQQKAAQSIENQLTGLDIQKVKRKEKQKENLEAMFSTSLSLPDKDKDGRPINKTFNMKDVLEKLSKPDTIIIQNQLPQQQLAIEASQAGPSQLQLKNEAEEEGDAGIEDATGKVEEYVVSNEEEEARKLKGLSVIYYINEVPFYKGCKRNIDKDNKKNNSFTLIYEDASGKEAEATVLGNAPNVINELFEAFKDNTALSFLKMDAAALLKSLIKKVYKNVKPGLLPLKLAAGRNREGDVQVLDIKQSGLSGPRDIWLSELKQKGTGLKKRRIYKGHSKAPSAKPLTIEFIDSTKGKFGNKYINLAQLQNYNHLQIVDGNGKIIYDEQISDGVKKLLTQRTPSVGKFKGYTDKDLRKFAEILRICDFVPRAGEMRSAKWLLVKDFIKAPENTDLAIEQEVSNMLGKGLNMADPSDEIIYVSRGISARNAGNTSRYLARNVKDKIKKLFNEQIIDSEQKTALLSYF